MSSRNRAVSAFADAIAALGERLDSEPESFMEYWSRAGLAGKPRTADHISVQNLAGLDPVLAAAGLFPFRLGRARSGKGTAFALARADHIHDFFLRDVEIFSSAPELFEPDVDREQLYQFLWLGNQVEVNAVNLAIASGLLAEALSLDPGTARIAPATMVSTFSFPVRPTSRPLVHEHVGGQVEIDAAFLARRAGRRVLVVLEAKHGVGREAEETLAKTKLAYPLSAISSKGDLPSDLVVVPVYLRSYTDGNELVFRVAECVWPDMEGLGGEAPRPPAVTGLDVAGPGRTLSLQLDASWPGLPSE